MSLYIDTSDIHNFKELLNKIKLNKVLDSSNHTLKIYCLRSELSLDILYSHILENTTIEIKKLNDFIECVVRDKKSNEIDVVFYCFKDPKEPLIFVLSISGKDRIDIAVERLIRYLPLTYYIWIPLNNFNDLKEEIIDAYENDKGSVVIDHFSGIKPEYDFSSSYFRPDVSRKIEYEASDGINAIREMKSIYGIFPTKIGFIIDNKISFSVNNRNVYIIKNGFPYLDIVWDIINLALKKYEIIKEAIAPVKFAIKRENNVIDFELIPLKIRFSQSKNLDDIERFFSELEKSEERYCIINPLLISGSLFFSADVFDENKKSLLSVSGDENSINITPKVNCEHDSLSKFCEKVNSLDPSMIISGKGS